MLSAAEPTPIIELNLHIDFARLNVYHTVDTTDVLLLSSSLSSLLSSKATTIVRVLLEEVHVRLARLRAEFVPGFFPHLS